MVRFQEVETRGVKYPIRFGFNATADFSEMSGLTIADLQKLGENITPSAVRSLAYVGLKHGARINGEKFQLTIEDIGDMMDEDPSFLENVLKCFSNDLPQNNGEEKKQDVPKGKKQ